MDPLSRIEFFAIIEELKQEGRTIITSTPYLDEAEKGDDILFFKNGRIILQGSISRIKKEFPAKIVSITPDAPIFDYLEELKRIPGMKDKTYVRGRQIKILVEQNFKLSLELPQSELKEVPATLEDIFLFYERRADDG